MRVVWLRNRHRRCRRLLSAYLDGEVTASERRTVDEHLSKCGACASELEELKATVALLRELPYLPVPRSFALEREPAPADGGLAC
jgi:anti-sigma factor RsiW